LNLLITGGCGFIGINLIYHFLNRHDNHRIRVVDNLSAGKREDLSLIVEFTEIKREEIRDVPSQKMELVNWRLSDEVKSCMSMHLIHGLS